jgi:hypothetical protein
LHGATQDIFDAKGDDSKQILAQVQAQQTIKSLAQTAAQAGDMQMAQKLMNGARQIPTDSPMDENTLETLIGYQNLHNTLADRAAKQADTNEKNAKAAQQTQEANKLQLTNPYAAAGAAAQTSELQSRAQMEQAQANAYSTHPEIAGVMPHLVPAATKEVADAGKAYSKTVAAGRDMKSFYDLATQQGNAIAYSYSPVLGVLTLNSSHGTTRINTTEIHQYGGAGSAMDRVEGFFGKQTTGASIPPNILKDMLTVSNQMTANARDKYGDDVKVTNSTYKSNFSTTPPIGTGTTGGTPHAGLIAKYGQ